jgi:hypothetical protein
MRLGHQRPGASPVRVLAPAHKLHKASNSNRSGQLMCYQKRTTRKATDTLRAGALTGGPPLSSHRRFKIPGFGPSILQVMPTSPVPLDKPPYFKALVASSCIPMEIASAACGESLTGGPSTWSRSGPACGSGLREALRRESVTPLRRRRRRRLRQRGISAKLPSRLTQLPRSPPRESRDSPQARQQSVCRQPFLELNMRSG